jgi:branched-chain amino acid transport system substrate-binding protein
MKTQNRQPLRNSRPLAADTIWLAAAILAMTCGNGLAADKGLTDTEIVIGQCAALTGPTANLGLGMKAGLTAAFDEANARGGVNGRKIRLVAADDGYEPEKTVDCTAKLIDDGVFALAGYVGTPTGKVAIPIVTEMKVPLVGLFTGAMLFREPVQHYVLNVRASYDDETRSLVDYLVGQTGAKRIAVFYQDDSFGLAGLSGTEKALAARKMQLVSKGSFARNTLSIKAGMAAVMEGNPDAVIAIGPYKPTTEFIKQARAAGLKSSFSTVSFVGTESLIAELGAGADDVIISQVVPSPVSETIPLSREYQAALKQCVPGEVPSYVSFEGYVSARVLLVALERAGRDLDREKLVAAVEGITRLDLGGLGISFSASNHQGSEAVFLTRVKAGVAQPITAQAR